VVAWASHQYDKGRGGFRLGVDLVGGTILVYEVDETKMPDNFKAEDLAAALKRRIDPADLYNITIRPVTGSPPRVEIILPTGGKHQAAAEKRNWDKLLDEAFVEFPGKAKDKDNPYLTVKQRGDNGGLAGLTDAVAKNNPDVSREIISDWVEKHGNPGGGKDKRMLTSEEVENIKNLIEKQGRLEFSILANDHDDEEAFTAARAEIKKQAVKDKDGISPLARLEIRALPRPRRATRAAGSPSRSSCPTSRSTPIAGSNWASRNCTVSGSTALRSRTTPE
jgi:preprotein translocase subunit SecD